MFHPASDHLRQEFINLKRSFWQQDTLNIQKWHDLIQRYLEVGLPCQASIIESTLASFLLFHPGKIEQIEKSS